MWQTQPEIIANISIHTYIHSQNIVNNVINTIVRTYIRVESTLRRGLLLPLQCTV